MLRRRWPVVALALWSAYVWITRIVNAAGDNDSSMVSSTVLSVSMLVLAAASGAVLVRARGRGVAVVEARVWQVFAGWTIAVWIVRAVQIALAEHEVAFKVVHVVLGLISIALAALTWRTA